MTTRNKKVAAISQAVIQQDTQRDQRTSFFQKDKKQKSVWYLYRFCHYPVYDKEEGEGGSDDYKEDCKGVQEACHQPPGEGR